MKITNLGEWHDLYLKTDVLLLADVFESFRNLSLTYYGLDPACYLGAPSLAWDAMLKYTKVVIENITDYDMYLFIQKGIKGGMCTVGAIRHVKANNPYMPNWDSCNPTSYITYQDANNLYGWAMYQPLPIGNYKWEDPENFSSNFIESFDFSKENGYIFSVDLEYPKELHDLHNDYPLAPEKIIPPLCPYMKDLSKELNYKIIKC